MIGSRDAIGKQKCADRKTKNPVTFMTGFFALLVTPRGIEPRLPP